MKMPSLIARLLGLTIHRALAPTHLHCPCCHANLLAGEVEAAEDRVSVPEKPWRINIYVHEFTRHDAVREAAFMLHRLREGVNSSVCGNGWLSVRQFRPNTKDIYYGMLDNEISKNEVEQHILNLCIALNTHIVKSPDCSTVPVEQLDRFFKEIQPKVRELLELEREGQRLAAERNAQSDNSHSN